MKKVAILGASYLQKPLYEKASEMGIQTIAFAWKEGTVCDKIASKYYPISILDKELILEKCKEEKIDGILSISSDIAVSTWNYVAHKMNLKSNSIECGSICSDKYETRLKLKEHNLPTPEFEIFIQAETKTYKQRKIVKPVDRSGSLGVSILEVGENAEELIKTAINVSLKGACIVEDYIEGKEYSIESISQNGQHHILAITEKITTGSPHFVETGHFQPANLQSDIEQKVKKISIDFLNCLGIKEGASHIEVIINNNGIFCLEVGARMGGDFIGSNLVQLSTGYDYLKNCIHISLGKKIDSVEISNNKSGILFKTDKNLKRITEITNNSETKIIKEELGIIKEEELSKSGDRKGYLIYKI